MLRPMLHSNKLTSALILNFVTNYVFVLLSHNFIFCVNWFLHVFLSVLTIQDNVIIDSNNQYNFIKSSRTKSPLPLQGADDDKKINTHKYLTYFKDAFFERYGEPCAGVEQAVLGNDAEHSARRARTPASRQRRHRLALLRLRQPCEAINWPLYNQCTSTYFLKEDANPTLSQNFKVENLFYWQDKLNPIVLPGWFDCYK